jgi:hypothetical protein
MNLRSNKIVAAQVKPKEVLAKPLKPIKTPEKPKDNKSGYHYHQLKDCL